MLTYLREIIKIESLTKLSSVFNRKTTVRTKAISIFKLIRTEYRRMLTITLLT